MNFKKRKIRHNLNKIKQYNETAPESESPVEKIPETNFHQSRKTSNNSNSIHFLGIGAGVIVLFALFWIAFSMIKTIDFSSLVFSFGKNLHKDDNKLTNFLLVGVGGSEHDGSNLTDTIILASLDEHNKLVKMLSLPRDLYIDDKLTGGQRINKLYDTYLVKYKNSAKAMGELEKTVSEMTDMPIQYYIKIDFNGFVKIVDALGGVDVNVEKSIYDTTYPLGETEKYTTFKIDAGPQHLDGDTALKYARSRHTTSDFDRARRQQLLLAAIKEKAFSLELLTNPSKIQNLYNSVADSLETNLSVAEIIELAKVAKDINKDSIQSRVITDDYGNCGGLLYTPVRDYFGGAAVLLPAGERYEEINKFSHNYFNSPSLLTNEIQVLNGTKTSGLALTALNRLSRECLNVVYYGNAANRELKTSTIYYQLPASENTDEKKADDKSIVPANLPPEIAIIKQFFNAPVVEGIPAEYLESPKRANTVIVVELGADYKQIMSDDPFDHLKYMTPIAKEENETTTDTGEHPLNSEAKTAITGETSTADTIKKTPTTP